MKRAALLTDSLMSWILSSKCFQLIKERSRRMIKQIGFPNKCVCAKPVKIQCMQILIVLLVSKTFFQETFCFHFVGHKLQALSKTDNLIMLSQLGPRCMHQGFFLPPRSVSPLRSENCAFHTFSEFSSFSAVTVFHRLGNITTSYSHIIPTPLYYSFRFQAKECL